MNILDENILEGQRQLLLRWHVPFRQIGYEVGRKGLTDDEIIPFLLRFRQPTFFTLDRDFYDRLLCHKRYGLVFLDVAQSEAAIFVRRLLRHPEFDTHSKRMGSIIRALHSGLKVWHLPKEQELFYNWLD